MELTQKEIDKAIAMYIKAGKPKERKPSTKNDGEVFTYKLGDYLPTISLGYDHNKGFDFSI